MLGAIELGGTKIICGVGKSHNEIVDKARFDTKTPGETLDDIIHYFSRCEGKFGKLKGIGIGTFGPVNLIESADYGTILNTPKPNWSGFRLLNSLKQAFDVPIAITTDVNAALLAEHRLGAAKNIDDAVYITIGTGVGAGIMVNGNFVNGFLHPELGHMRVPTSVKDGNCLFHSNCIEGLVSGPAIAKLAGKPAHQIEDDHPIWTETALAIADMCSNITHMLATRKIILGGGVMSREGLINKVREHFRHRAGSYLPIEELVGSINQFIVPPQLASDSGLTGAFLLIESKNE